MLSEPLEDRNYEYDLCIVSFGSCESQFIRAGHSLMNASFNLLYKYPSVRILPGCVPRTPNITQSHEQAALYYKHAAKYWMVQDADQLVPGDLLIKEFEYMENHPECYGCGAKIYKHNGKAIAWDKNGNHVDEFIAPDEDGVIRQSYFGFNLMMLRSTIFDVLDPPYFMDWLSIIFKNNYEGETKDEVIFKLKQPWRDEERALMRKDGVMNFAFQAFQKKLEIVVLPELKIGHMSIGVV